MSYDSKGHKGEVHRKKVKKTNKCYQFCLYTYVHSRKTNTFTFFPQAYMENFEKCAKRKRKKHFIVPCYLWQFPLFFCTFPLCNFRYPNPSDRLIFVKVMGTFLGTNTNKILVFVIDDSLGMGGGVWWGRVVVQNLPSERKLPLGKVQKKSKKKLTNQHFGLHIHT